MRHACGYALRRIFRRPINIPMSLSFSLRDIRRRMAERTGAGGWLVYDKHYLTVHGIGSVTSRRMTDFVMPCLLTRRYCSFPRYGNKEVPGNCMAQLTLLSGCGLPMPPPSDQSFCCRLVVGASFCSSAVQNQPLTSLGSRSGRLQPLKSQRRPDVQMYFTWKENRKIPINIHLHIQIVLCNFQHSSDIRKRSKHYG